ncbi:MAG TPA: hypothetical protein VM368_03115, partial [Flavisolibacter sp.]|nr:hypothetical protein [Flavisolibacter sp.]
MRYFLLLFLAIDFRSIAQSSSVDSLEYDISKIYSLALDANLAAVLKIFQEQSSKPLTSRSQNIRDRFLKRFGYAHDSSDYLQMRNSSLNDILLVYRDYWRMSMLDPQAKYDSVLLKHLGKVLADRYKLSEPVERDTLEFYYKKAITDAGYYSTLFGKTGRLFDLLVWNHQYDTVYKFKIKKETIEAPVVFMEDFLTLGWGEYATLGRNHSGGWATRDTLFVVKKAYKLDSENFLVSYLAHEGKHFSDYKKFPKLSGI